MVFVLETTRWDCFCLLASSSATCISLLLVVLVCDEQRLFFVRTKKINPTVVCWLSLTRTRKTKRPRMPLDQSEFHSQYTPVSTRHETTERVSRLWNECRNVISGSALLTSHCTPRDVILAVQVCSCYDGHLRSQTTTSSGGFLKYGGKILLEFFSQTSR